MPAKYGTFSIEEWCFKMLNDSGFGVPHLEKYPAGDFPTCMMTSKSDDDDDDDDDVLNSKAISDAMICLLLYEEMRWTTNDQSAQHIRPNMPDLNPQHYLQFQTH